MSSNIMIDNRNSSVRDIAKLFPEEKRLGTKASDLVSGIALTVCLDIDEAFGEVLGPGTLRHQQSKGLPYLSSLHEVGQEPPFLSSSSIAPGSGARQGRERSRRCRRYAWRARRGWALI